MVTREDVLGIAKLAKLSVEETELDALTLAMGEIIAFADTIQQAGDATMDFDNINCLSNVFREDTVVPSYDRAAILQNVQGGEDGFFPVPGRK